MLLSIYIKINLRKLHLQFLDPLLNGASILSMKEVSYAYFVATVEDRKLQYTKTGEISTGTEFVR